MSEITRAKCSRCGSKNNLSFISDSLKTFSNQSQDFMQLCNKCHEKLSNELEALKKQNIGNDEIIKGFEIVFSGLSKKYKMLDLSDPNLIDTPARIARAWTEMLEGLDINPEDIINSSSFPAEGYDEMILLRNIEFSSICSHHFLPFIGTADVAYIPDIKKGKVIGISKLARLVDCFAKRPQLQERMAEQISNALVKYLAPLGVAVRIQAKHLCISCRGIKKINSIMVTTSLKGVFKDNPSTRAEFLNLIKEG